MRFLYLIQGKAENVKGYTFLNTAHSSLRGLTYDAPLDGFEFMPKSSFAQGRNHLYAVARELLDEFDYFVFLDDDVIFRRGSFERMEHHLRHHRPSVGIPLTDKTRVSAIGVEIAGGGGIRPFTTKQRFFLNDEQYLALERRTIAEGKILPYLEDWDQESWFVCCLIQEALIQHHYHDTAWQFNDCETANEQHSGDYPHNLEFAQTASREWLEANLPDRRNVVAFYPALLTLSTNPRHLLRNMLRAGSALLRRNSFLRRVKRRLPSLHR